MVERAFAVEKETGVHYDCPAAMVNHLNHLFSQINPLSSVISHIHFLFLCFLFQVKAPETVWFVDTASIENHKNHNNAKTMPKR